MKIYSDTCAIQRPLDSKSQLRILLEAESILGLFEYVRNGNAKLITSDILRFEIRKCQNIIRRKFAEDVLKVASINVNLTREIKSRATELEMFGFKSLDALHLASAESSKADYFCTCDDGILKKVKTYNLFSINVMLPTEIVKVLEL